MQFLNFFSKILDILYYRHCYICTKKCVDTFLCKDCIEKIYSNMSFHKSEKFNTTIYSGTIYENEILKVIRGLKYHKKQDFAQIIANIIIKTADNYKLDLSDFIVCPVPIHETRLKKRKYNHMELVAAIVAKHFKLKIETNYIKRIKNTQPLYNLSHFERKKVIENAFEVSEEIKNKKILLLDDIVTTGATISELSKLINNNHTQKLIVICATRSNNCNF